MNGTCSVDGCERVGRIARGMCIVHYNQMRASGALELLPRPSIEWRLWSRLIEQPNGCLDWPGGTSRNGYGVIYFDGKRVSTHRLAWELVNGPIPEGMVICHKCDNPPCCNPEHMFLGTQSDNLADMAAKHRGRAPTFKTHCPQGHEFTEANTFVGPQGCRSCRTCRYAANQRYRRKQGQKERVFR